MKMFKLQAPVTKKTYSAVYGFAMLIYIFSLVVFFKPTFTDIPDLIQLHANPFEILVAEKRQFLHGSLANILLGWFLGAKTEAQIRLLYAAIFSLSMGMLVYCALKKYQNPKSAILFLLVLCASPIVHVLTTWLGKSDSLLLIGYMLLYFMDTHVLISAGAFLIVLAHKEMGIIVLAFHMAISNERKISPVLVGLVIGALAHALYMKELPSLPASRLDYLIANYDHIKNYFFERLGYNLWGAFVPFFVFAFIKNLLSIKAMTMSLAAFVIAMLASDFVRVYTMLSVPIFFSVSERFAIKDHINIKFSYWLIPLFTVSGRGRDVFNLAVKYYTEFIG